MVGSIFLKKGDYGVINIISIILIAIIFIINGYLTYQPIENMLFCDPQHETYEIVSK